uniref:Endonuclease/exonuclease/phosphatase domain-containing protein n=1 Tax=Tetranychus urticae TaxID=32264 RepID=T1KVI4_TETUR
MNNFCGNLDSIFGNCKRTKAATKNLMKISAEEKPDFTAFNEGAVMACFDSESFQFITKCCFELSIVTCVKARWNNIKHAIICGYFSSNVAKYSVEDLTKDLKSIAAVIKTKMGSYALKLFVGDFNAYHSSWSKEERLSHYKKKKGESVMTFCNITEMYVLNPFQPNYVVGAKETVCDLILGCRVFKEGIVSCKMELNSSSDHKLIRIIIDNNKFVPEKTDTASEGSNPERQNAGHRHDGQRGVPGVPGVASGLRMPDSANWPKY